MTRTVLDRLQSLLVALSLAFLVWMYVNSRERWVRRGHDETVDERSSPATVENPHELAAGRSHSIWTAFGPR
jgi:hypothetical protein